MPLSIDSRQMAVSVSVTLPEEMNETEAVETEPANERELNKNC